MAFANASFPRQRASSYPRIRSQIEQGDLLLCSGNAWFSKMIQRTTKSVWSHVAFVMRIEEIDRVMVLESVEPLGVRTVPLSKYLDDYNSKGKPYKGGLVIARHDRFKAVATDSKLHKFGRFAADLFGYPYDKDEIAKIAARIMGSKVPFTRQERKDLKPDREYICSEYVWEAYRHIGIKIASDYRGFISPADFAKDSAIRLKFVLKRK